MLRSAAASALLVWLSGCAALPGHREPLDGRVIPCPCTVEELAMIPAEHPRAIITRDSDLATAKYHPGAFVTYRVFDPDTDPVAGNQCSFDRHGRLIPAGPAAGTPDYVSPERSLLGHFVVDVLPFHRLGWMKYHRKGWAPIAREFGESSPLVWPIGSGAGVDRHPGQVFGTNGPPPRTF